MSGFTAEYACRMCVSRWKEAPEVGIAPPVTLRSTQRRLSMVVDLADLKRHALELSVGLMTYVVMPHYTRLVARWLFR